jgi:hypothetical protein
MLLTFLEKDFLSKKALVFSVTIAKAAFEQKLLDYELEAHL